MQSFYIVLVVALVALAQVECRPGDAPAKAETPAPNNGAGGAVPPATQQGSGFGNPLDAVKQLTDKVLEPVQGIVDKLNPLPVKKLLPWPLGK
ncbi:hypothetical protein ONE63_007273 [Megalurothrips usitatus]|uniref:Secreted protein n=1 Tax=Megalurothrips usitatus TaxID=439358 RepID=A0AAV7XVM7_9NEOP|nr:hypothetical protein ONE63_007273 [Megalurothrips usitatus]